MWIWIAYKFAKFYAERLNRSENIPKSCRGLLFLKHPVPCESKNIYPLKFSETFSQRLRIFKQNCTCLLYVEIYGKLQDCIQLSLNLTQLFHIKHTHLTRLVRRRTGWGPTVLYDFIAKDEWRPDSPDLNPLDCHVWGAMLQALYKLHSKTKTIPELKSALQQIWDDLPQTTINKAINDFRKRLNACASTGDGHLNRWYEYYTKIFRLNSVSETVINCLL